VDHISSSYAPPGGRFDLDGASFYTLTMSETISFDCAVIGKGLIGGAAARYLARAGARVLLLGPDEPDKPMLRNRPWSVFSSHYDEGRITRLIGRDRVYSKLAELAIEQYAELESESGTRFHYPVGMLVAEAPHVPDGHMKNPLATARALGRRFELYEASDRSWKDQFPFLDFPETYRVIHEPAPAGYINPRALIRAQLAVSAATGTKIIRETVTAIRQAGTGWSVKTAEGDAYRTKKAIVAAGAFTNFNGLLPQRLPFRPETESILLARVTDGDARRLEDAPSVIYLIDDVEISDVYMTPPLRYPDGAFYIKLGANTVYDRELETLDDVGRWFRTGDSDRSKSAYTRAVRSLWPGLDLLSLETKRCILCRTPNGYPIIDEIEDGLFVAAGGNGGSAKCSDALGHLAAGLAQGWPWPPDVPRELFRIPRAS